jgi:Tol biopolymer transport system component
MQERSTATGGVRDAPAGRLRAAVVAMVCIAGLAAWAGVAQASVARGTASNGLIVFQAHVGAFNQLFTIKPNGSGLEQITRIPFTGDTEGAEQADWSPDGQAIAFDAPSGNGVDIFINVFTVRADGSGLSEQPLAMKGFNGAPSYSPDGTKIAFDQDAGDSQPTAHGIFVANADGSEPRRITTGIATPEAYDTNADWSPDGARLAFTASRTPSSRRSSSWAPMAVG